VWWELLVAVGAVVTVGAMVAVGALAAVGALVHIRAPSPLDVSSLDVGWECWNVRRLGVT
jgi:hypothetical protein